MLLPEVKIVVDDSLVGYVPTEVAWNWTVPENVAIAATLNGSIH
jgi:hypothetical protein